MLNLRAAVPPWRGAQHSIRTASLYLLHNKFGCHSFTVLYLCLLPRKVPINHAEGGSFIIWPSREALWRKFEISLRHFLCS